MTRVRWDRVIAVIAAIIVVLFLAALATVQLPWDPPRFHCVPHTSPTRAPWEDCG